MKLFSKSNVIGLLIAVLVLHAHALSQNLTVREIMAEPSIAGMRVEGEKLSPDGAKVVYLWNAEGKIPRDLYLVSTSGGATTKILSPRDLPIPSRTPTSAIRLSPVPPLPRITRIPGSAIIWSTPSARRWRRCRPPRLTALSSPLRA